MGINIKDNKIFAILRVSKQAFWQYKLQIFALIALGFLSGILEGVGVNALIPLFSFIIGDGQGGDDFISQAIEKFFLYFNISFSLKYLLVFICVLFIFKAMTLLFINYIKVRITSDYEERTRSELLDKTLKTNWPYLLKQKLGHLENVLMVDVQRSSGLLGQIGGAIMVITGLLMYVAVAINISVYITLVTLIIGGVMFLIFKPLIYKTRVVAYKTTRMNKKVAHYVNENILGLKAVKALDVGGKISKIAEKYFKELKKLNIRTFLINSISASSSQPISIIFISIVFALSYKTSNFNLASLIAVIYLIQRIFLYFQNAQSNLHGINDAYPYLRNVLDYQEKAVRYKEENRGTCRFAFNNLLEFKNVNFSYQPEREVLSSVNFSIKKGEMVGLIGSSGAGKTTIVDLILRLFNPNSGTILLDGKDAKKINLKEWRKNIGYVSQDIFLMNGTIVDNIKFYSNSITNTEIEKVAKMANIYDFIQNCPDKFNTVIGDRGGLLSAGQRQRIIIARILARKPQLLILDEATSALDNESEIKIQKVIENLKGKVTVFVIAHRLSTVVNSDKLLVLENGRIVEQGEPSKLLKDKRSYFYKVYNIRE
ncbi:ABC transporter ATP-binding protein [Candidatus Parcubacteria bacterium]|nr:ABC transporter ATP-binding protein [Candidatus Parcubacteria bacterium]